MKHWGNCEDNDVAHKSVEVNEACDTGAVVVAAVKNVSTLMHSCRKLLKTILWNVFFKNFFKVVFLFTKCTHTECSTLFRHNVLIVGLWITSAVHGSFIPLNTQSQTTTPKCV